MRKITFTIPGEPSVEVTAIENDDGTLSITAKVVGSDTLSADLRGLFFDVADENLIGNLLVDGEDITKSDLEGDVSNLGSGVNMNGDGTYDAGVAFGTAGASKDYITETTFILSTADDTPLTLDDIANVMFGARLTSIGDPNDPDSLDGSAKISVLAPAAPDAIDDDTETLEDTQIVIDVVANDTDADGDTLTIVDVTDPPHGTVEIVDNKIVYTPDLNFGGGFDSFEYTIDDGNGGCDTAMATVWVEAVADAPLLEVTTKPGAAVNEIVLVINPALFDTDGSESLQVVIDTSALAPGASLSGTVFDNPQGPFEVVLTLPDDAGADFDLQIDAISTEASNGDTAITSAIVEVDAEFATASGQVEFTADDQSIWDSGDAFSYSRNDFLGFDTGNKSGSVGPLGYQYDVRVGLQSSFDFGGGSIDATIPYDISVDTFYNVTTDALMLTPFGSLADGGSFLTNGPYIDYSLDFIFDVLLSADVSVSGVEVFDVTVDEFYSYNIFGYDSQDPNQDPFSVGSTSDPVSVQFDWPEVDVGSTEGATGTYFGSERSDDVLKLNLDADAIATSALPGNPFDLTAGGFVLGTGAEGNLQLLDVDLFGSLDFVQSFDLIAGNVDASIIFENGDIFAFDLGSPTVFQNASTLDQDGDGDIEFVLDFGMTGANLTNDTDMVFDVGYNVDIMKGSAEVKLAGATVYSGSLGPAASFGGSADVASIGVYDNTFDLALQGDVFEFMA